MAHIYTQNATYIGITIAFAAFFRIFTSQSEKKQMHKFITQTITLQ